MGCGNALVACPLLLQCKLQEGGFEALLTAESQGLGGEGVFLRAGEAGPLSLQAHRTEWGRKSPKEKNLGDRERRSFC